MNVVVARPYLLYNVSREWVLEELDNLPVIDYMQGITFIKVLF